MEIIDVPSFHVIGKLGWGTSKTAKEWIAPLWDEASRNVLDIADAIMLDDSGNAAGIWAIMSDMDETFAPWDSVRGGKYLAGFTARDGSPAPAGWTKWHVPGFRYAVARTTMAGYADTMKRVLAAYFSDNGFTLAGAIHEKYPHPGDSDVLELYFPILRLGRPAEWDNDGVEHWSEFSRALLAGGKIVSIPDGHDWYGGLIGEWDVDWVDHEGTPEERRVKGEWLFSWILGGRAIQDVFICPSRAERERGTPYAGEFGTSIRTYNPERRVWEIFYTDGGNSYVLEGVRNANGDIVQRSIGDGDCMGVWTISDIGKNSFHWTNRVSEDGGKTWTLVGEIAATRRVGGE